MRRDLHTPNPEAAAAWNRNHGVDTTPGPDPDYVDFPTPDREHCPGCEKRDCLDCAIARVLAKGWGR